MQACVCNHQNEFVLRRKKENQFITYVFSKLVVAGNEAIFQLLKRTDSFMHSLFVCFKICNFFKKKTFKLPDGYYGEAQKSDNGPGRGCVSSTQQHKVENFQIEQQRRRTIFQEIKSQVEIEIRIHHCSMMSMSPGEVATQAQP
ncbi:hypothetical protein D917_07187 [Trichinella nativa]|uniref:Uncharacterized protein n=1 Tax=Trichinella nativa TaxID=6335 RepID=A0A1Y3ETL0_9BILA|nr:hypothetical protein D917_07187 [Trichinella nativa]